MYRPSHLLAAESSFFYLEN